MIEWVKEPSALGLFSETTAEECEKSKANKDACYTACIAAGATGWNLIMAPFCTDICMNEACGNGIILTPHDMEKAGAVIGTCMQQCVDDAQKLPDNGARQAALAACPTTCNMAHVLEQVHAGNVTPPPPPAKSNAVWWVLGGLAVVGAVAVFLLPKGGVGLVMPAASENPFWSAPKTKRERRLKLLNIATTSAYGAASFKKAYGILDVWRVEGRVSGTEEIELRHMLTEWQHFGGKREGVRENSGHKGRYVVTVHGLSGERVLDEHYDEVASPLEAAQRVAIGVYGSTQKPRRIRVYDRETKRTSTYVHTGGDLVEERANNS